MLLAGTADGIYTVADGPARAVGRFGQSIRRIIRYGTEIPAAGDGNLSCSRDGGRAWRVFGNEAHTPSAANLAALAADPAAPRGVLAGTNSGEVWWISPDAVWTHLAAGLPTV